MIHNTIKYRKSVFHRKWKRHMLNVYRCAKIYKPTFRYNPLPNIQERKITPKNYKCPTNFIINHNIEGIIQFINKLRKSINRYRAIKLDLSGIIEIDIVTIVMLLSHLEYISQREVRISGNYPHDKKAYKTFVDSGFLALIQTLNTKQPATRTGKSLIVDLGRNYYNSEIVADVNQKALTLINKQNDYQLYKKLNGIVGEMGGNAMQYAYNDVKHYMYGYSYSEEEKCLTFIFADAGFGIITTLKRSLGNKIIDLISINGEVSVLQNAFLQKYSSKTGDQNRNLGLPFIRKAFLDGYISNLQVISNHSYINFSDSKQSVKLTSNYPGTLYSWKIYE